MPAGQQTPAAGFCGEVSPLALGVAKGLAISTVLRWALTRRLTVEACDRLWWPGLQSSAASPRSLIPALCCRDEHGQGTDTGHDDQAVGCGGHQRCEADSQARAAADEHE